jgi:hypothetical protein
LFSEKISPGQLTAWLFVAMVPTVIQLSSGDGWLGIFIAVILSILCCWLRWKWGVTPDNRIYAGAMWLLMVLLIGVLSKESVRCWPRGGHVAVPLILLALSLWTAWKGTRVAASAGSVLFWLFLILYLLLFGAGIHEVQAKWLKPTAGDVDAQSCILLLTPAAAAMHLKTKEGIKPRLILLGVFCVIASVITAGVLSPRLAAGEEYPFYRMIRNLTVLGQARRFEAVLSASTTIGWYSLICVYLTVSGEMADKIRSGWRRKGIVLSAGAAAAILLWNVRLPGILLLVLSAILWVLIPLMAGAKEVQKKS